MRALARRVMRLFGWAHQEHTQALPLKGTWELVGVEDTADGVLIYRHDARRLGLELDKIYPMRMVNRNSAYIFVSKSEETRT